MTILAIFGSSVSSSESICILNYPKSFLQVPLCLVILKSLKVSKDRNFDFDFGKVDEDNDDDGDEDVVEVFWVVSPPEEGREGQEATTSQPTCQHWIAIIVIVIIIIIID